MIVLERWTWRKILDVDRSSSSSHIRLSPVLDTRGDSTKVSPGFLDFHFRLHMLVPPLVPPRRWHGIVDRPVDAHVRTIGQIPTYTQHL